MSNLPQRQVHLDFHTSEKVKGVGSEFSKEQFKKCLKVGHVNSITLFAKCHHGWGYFLDSKTIPHHPHLDVDLLPQMLEACEEIGVAAPIYISAGLDQQYVTKHPDHIVLSSADKQYPTVAVDADGDRYVENEHAMYNLLCYNSPYLDYLVKQTEEVVEKFMPCGIFLDISAPRLCYCKYCRVLAEEKGLDPEDPQTYVELSHVTYKKYYDTINKAARAIKPDIRIFHNGGHVGHRLHTDADTHFELESLPTGGWGYDHFPKTSRFVSGLGKDYLGMTGKFHLSWGEFGGFKHPNALKYEVALSLANGAKCSVGDQMHPLGFMDEATYELIGLAYAEAEKVEEYCVDVESVADIGILSVEATGGPRNASSDIGACRMMLEGKYLYDIIDEQNDMSKYKLVILPDEITMTPELEAKLKAYVAAGGKVLCAGMSGIGSDGKPLFDIGVDKVVASEYNPCYYAPDYEAMGLSKTSYVVYGKMYNTVLSDSAVKVLGKSKEPYFNRAIDHYCSHQHAPFTMEEGRAAVIIGREGGYISWDVFTEYAKVGSCILRDTVVRTIDELLGDRKTLKTNLYSMGVVALNHQATKDRLVLHALYATPVKRGSGTEIIEDLVTVADTEFTVRTDKNVRSVKLVPQNKELDFVFENGECRFKIDSFTCSQIVVIE